MRKEKNVRILFGVIVMDTKAAIAYQAGQPLHVETVQLDGPRAGEVLIEVMATGVCHSVRSID